MILSEGVAAFTNRISVNAISTDLDWAIVKHIVPSPGGKVWVESVAGHGA